LILAQMIVNLAQIANSRHGFL